MKFNVIALEIRPVCHLAVHDGLYYSPAEPSFPRVGPPQLYTDL